MSQDLYIALYSLAGAIIAFAGCTVNISGTTLFDNNLASTIDGGEAMRTRVWEVQKTWTNVCMAVKYDGKGL